MPIVLLGLVQVKLTTSDSMTLARSVLTRTVEHGFQPFAGPRNLALLLVVRGFYEASDSLRSI
jgi:hypothetical protein